MIPLNRFTDKKVSPHVLLDSLKVINQLVQTTHESLGFASCAFRSQLPNGFAEESFLKQVKLTPIPPSLMFTPRVRAWQCKMCIRQVCGNQSYFKISIFSFHHQMYHNSVQVNVQKRHMIMSFEASHNHKCTRRDPIVQQILTWTLRSANLSSGGRHIPFPDTTEAAVQQFVEACHGERIAIIAEDITIFFFGQVFNTSFHRDVE